VEMDGYYAIITNDFASPISKIIEEYKQLVKIEECFRITKSDLQGRPVYVYKPKRIDGHFMICFLALTFIRLIQKEIK
jgi:transposase